MLHRPSHPVLGFTRVLALLTALLLLTACGASPEDGGAAEPTGTDAPSPAATADAGEDATEDPAGEATEPESVEPATVRVGTTDTGTGGILWNFIRENGIAEEHGLVVDRTVQTAIGPLYDDFAAGRYDIVQAVPSGVLPMAAAGVPVQVLVAYSPAAVYLTAPGELSVPEDLEGLRIAGVTRSGSFRQAAAIIQELHGIDILPDAVPASNNLEAITQVVAGTADAAIVWEADLSLALNQHDQLEVAWSARDAFQEEFGGDLWSSIFAYRTDAEYPPEVLERFKEMVADAAGRLQEDTDLIDQLAQDVLDAPEGVYREAFESGRLGFVVADIDSDVEADMRAALELEQTHGDLEAEIPPAFFGAE